LLKRRQDFIANKMAIRTNNAGLITNAVSHSYGIIGFQIHFWDVDPSGATQQTIVSIGERIRFFFAYSQIRIFCDTTDGTDGQWQSQTITSYLKPAGTKNTLTVIMFPVIGAGSTIILLILNGNILTYSETATPSGSFQTYTRQRWCFGGRNDNTYRLNGVIDNPIIFRPLFFGYTNEQFMAANKATTPKEVINALPSSYWSGDSNRLVWSYYDLSRTTNDGQNMMGSEVVAPNGEIAATWEGLSGAATQHEAIDADDAAYIEATKNDDDNDNWNFNAAVTFPRAYTCIGLAHTSVCQSLAGKAMYTSIRLDFSKTKYTRTLFSSSTKTTKTAYYQGILARELIDNGVGSAGGCFAEAPTTIGNGEEARLYYSSTRYYYQVADMPDIVGEDELIVNVNNNPTSPVQAFSQI
jgi:hypothetical protein